MLWRSQAPADRLIDADDSHVTDLLLAGGVQRSWAGVLEVRERIEHAVERETRLIEQVSDLLTQIRDQGQRCDNRAAAGDAIGAQLQREMADGLNAVRRSLKGQIDTVSQALDLHEMTGPHTDA